MGLYKIITGEIRAEICGAYPESVLNAAAKNSVELRALEHVDINTLRFSFYETDRENVESICRKCMCELKILRVYGGSRSRKKVLRRKWLFAFAAMSAALLFLSSLFIWEIDVRGNESVSRGELLRALSECGVESGSFWPGLSADIVRSEVITKLPEIGWLAINVSGSRAVVLVRERTEKPEIYSEQEASNITAAKTGIIKRISVQNGRALVKKGDAVTQGETLISGAMDSLANGSRYVAAKGSVLADTWYELTAVAPEKEMKKIPGRLSLYRFALVFGKNRINLYPGSGKTIDECDKIIKEYSLGAEGVFSMPITLVAEELRRYDSEEADGNEYQNMERRLNDTLRAGVAGEIIQKSFTEGTGSGLQVLTMRAHCIEEIGIASPCF